MSFRFRTRPEQVSLLLLATLLATTLQAEPPTDFAEGWVGKSPREEIPPEFVVERSGGPAGKGSLVIQAAQGGSARGFVWLVGKDDSRKRRSLLQVFGSFQSRGS